MKSLFSLLIASHLAFMTGCSTSSSLEEHRKRADEYFQRGLYEESIVEYLNVLHAQPTNRPAQRNLGIAYYQTRDLDRAYPLLVRAARWDGQDIEVLLKLASLLSAAGSPQEA
ncbi:MAG: tetratricopeptide repeat protein, partial [Kiritimatiellia bacterium]